jgi:hypothetical protein
LSLPGDCRMVLMATGPMSGTPCKVYMPYLVPKATGRGLYTPPVRSAGHIHTAQSYRALAPRSTPAKTVPKLPAPMANWKVRCPNGIQTSRATPHTFSSSSDDDRVRASDSRLESLVVLRDGRGGTPSLTSPNSSGGVGRSLTGRLHVCGLWQSMRHLRVGLSVKTIRIKSGHSGVRTS